jgi:CHAT domain-containing protein
MKAGGKWKANDIIALYSNLGFAYWKTEQHSLAQSYFSKGYEIIKEKVPFTQQLGLLLRNYALYSLSIGDIEKAKELFNLSLSLNSKSDKNTNYQHYSTSDFHAPIIAIQCLEGLGDVYLKKFETDSIIDDALRSFKFYSKSIELMDRLRAGIQDESDKLYINESYHITHLKAIQASILFSNQIPNSLDFAFGISSRAKAAVLNQAVIREQGLHFTGVPSELLEKELKLRQSVSSLLEFYHEENLKATPSKKLLQQIESRLFDAQRDYRSMVRYIENEYPNYYALKFDTASVSINDVQRKLNSRQVLIDYIISDSMLISFAIAKDGYQWSSHKIDSFFFSNLSLFLREVNPTSFENLNRSNLENFVNSSYFLYQHLLEPFNSLIKGKELIIVPHLQLSTIPFCALITEKVVDPKGYYSLPYLVNTTPVSYFPSSKLFHNKTKTNPSFWHRAISFTPEYGIDTTLFSTLPYRQYLGDLPGAERESKAISKVLNGTLILGNDATEAYFKQEAGNYHLLHLAMHTYIDEQNPLYSKLIFSTSPDSSEDGLLNVYEVYGLRMKAKLVIISACRSGDGSLVKGEGLLSLARGFQYAGCPSLIAAQWRIDDFGGSEVMIEFARNIKNGESISIALQKAQAKFVQSADPLRSHPYFWASYQVIGNDEPLYYSFILKLSAGIVTLLVIVFLWIGLKGYTRWKVKVN